MKAKRVICVVKGHQWVVGRVAEKWARALIPDKKSYHNRACRRCTVEQWNADEAEREADAVRNLKHFLGGSEATKPIDPNARVLDPNEFP